MPSRKAHDTACGGQSSVGSKMEQGHKNRVDALVKRISSR